jgi:hypothetical protein
MASSSNRDILKSNEHIRNILINDKLSNEEKAQEVTACLAEKQHIVNQQYDLLSRISKSNAFSHTLAKDLETTINHFSNINVTVHSVPSQCNLLHVAAAWGGRASVEAFLHFLPYPGSAHGLNSAHTDRSFCYRYKQSEQPQEILATPIVAALIHHKYEVVTSLLDYYSRSFLETKSTSGGIRKPPRWGKELDATVSTFEQVTKYTSEWKHRPNSLLGIALKLIDSTQSPESELGKCLISLFNYKYKLPITNFAEVRQFLNLRSEDNAWANCSGFQYLQERHTRESKKQESLIDYQKEILGYFVKKANRLTKSKDHEMVERINDFTQLIAFMKKAIMHGTLHDPIPDSKLSRVKGDYLKLRQKLIWLFREDPSKLYNQLSLLATLDAPELKKLTDEQRQVMNMMLGGPIVMPPAPHESKEFSAKLPQKQETRVDTDVELGEMKPSSTRMTGMSGGMTINTQSNSEANSTNSLRTSTVNTRSSSNHHVASALNMHLSANNGSLSTPSHSFVNNTITSVATMGIMNSMTNIPTDTIAAATSSQLSIRAPGKK